MKVLFDTANVADIKNTHELEVLPGVTTNPSLVAKKRVDFKMRIREICTITSGSVSAEVLSLVAEEMIEEDVGSSSNCYGDYYCFYSPPAACLASYSGRC